MLEKGLFNPAALALAGAVKLYAAVLTAEMVQPHFQIYMACVMMSKVR